MKLTVNTILGVFDKSKDGKPFVTKNNKPYKKANVNFTETGSKVVSVMIWQGQTCEVGQVYDGEITEREWNGNKYYDLKVMSESEKLETRLSRIEFAIGEINRKLAKLEGKDTTSAGTPVPTFVPNTPTQAQAFKEKMDNYENINGEMNAIAEEDYNRY